MDSIIHFESSKSGELTCCFQGKYLHSKYNPINEGEKFAQNLNADFSPLCVFILEPALSYCAPYIKKKFQNAEICAIRFSNNFLESNTKWDRIFYLKSSISLSEQVFNSLSEEKLCSSLVFDWLPTKQIFANENLKAWLELKKAILKARDVIGTREYFSKRWLKNSIIFSANVSSTFLLEKGSSPIILALSGPSLKTSIPFIKKYRNSFFLIAASSAFMPLSKNGIHADLLISTDGGYWAKKHLEFPGEHSNLVFALEAESNIPKKILFKKEILPLCYPDGLEKIFLDSIGCPYMLSERNGTVAGTALCFAELLTSSNIYLCGLDQAPSPTFQHTQPNALEIDNAKKDFRLRTNETRINISRFTSEASLEIYRNWFISNSEFFSKRIFRLSDNFKYEYSLGKIKEVNWQFFKKNEISLNLKQPRFIQKEIKIKRSERKKILLEKLKKISQSEEFINEVFPMDSILIKRELSEEKKEYLKAKVSEKINKLLMDCEKLIK